MPVFDYQLRVTADVSQAEAAIRRLRELGRTGGVAFGAGLPAGQGGPGSLGEAARLLQTQAAAMGRWQADVGRALNQLQRGSNPAGALLAGAAGSNVSPGQLQASMQGLTRQLQEHSQRIARALDLHSASMEKHARLMARPLGALSNQQEYIKRYNQYGAATGPDISSSIGPPTPVPYGVGGAGYQKAAGLPQASHPYYNLGGFPVPWSSYMPQQTAISQVSDSSIRELTFALREWQALARRPAPTLAPIVASGAVELYRTPNEQQQFNKALKEWFSTQSSGPATNWYHGTGANFDRFDLNPPNRRTSDPNAYVGPHFADRWDIARGITGGDRSTMPIVGWGSGPYSPERPRVITSQVPGPILRYGQEYQLNRAMYMHAHERGMLPPEEYLQQFGGTSKYEDVQRYTPKDPELGGRFQGAQGTFLYYTLAEQQKRAIGESFRERMRGLGYAGIQYGNPVEGGQGLIGLDPGLINITHPGIGIPRTTRDSFGVRSGGNARFDDLWKPPEPWQGDFLSRAYPWLAQHGLRSGYPGLGGPQQQRRELLAKNPTADILSQIDNVLSGNQGIVPVDWTARRAFGVGPHDEGPYGEFADNFGVVNGDPVWGPAGSFNATPDVQRVVLTDNERHDFAAEQRALDRRIQIEDRRGTALARRQAAGIYRHITAGEHPGYALRESGYIEAERYLYPPGMYGVDLLGAHPDQVLAGQAGLSATGDYLTRPLNTFASSSAALRAQLGASTYPGVGLPLAFQQQRLELMRKNLPAIRGGSDEGNEPPHWAKPGSPHYDDLARRIEEAMQQTQSLHVGKFEPGDFLSYSLREGMREGYSGGFQGQYLEDPLQTSRPRPGPERYGVTPVGELDYWQMRSDTHTGYPGDLGGSQRSPGPIPGPEERINLSDQISEQERLMGARWHDHARGRSDAYNAYQEQLAGFTRGNGSPLEARAQAAYWGMNLDQLPQALSQSGGLSAVNQNPLIRTRIGAAHLGLQAGYDGPYSDEMHTGGVPWDEPTWAGPGEYLGDQVAQFRQYRAQQYAISRGASPEVARRSAEYKQFRTQPFQPYGYDIAESAPRLHAHGGELHTLQGQVTPVSLEELMKEANLEAGGSSFLQESPSGPYMGALERGITEEHLGGWADAPHIARARENKYRDAIKSLYHDSVRGRPLAGGHLRVPPQQAQEAQADIWSESQYGFQQGMMGGIGGTPYYGTDQEWSNYEASLGLPGSSGYGYAGVRGLRGRGLLNRSIYNNYPRALSSGPAPFPYLFHGTSADLSGGVDSSLAGANTVSNLQSLLGFNLTESRSVAEGYGRKLWRTPTPTSGVLQLGHYDDLVKLFESHLGRSLTTTEEGGAYTPSLAPEFAKQVSGFRESLLDQGYKHVAFQGAGQRQQYLALQPKGLQLEDVAAADRETVARYHQQQAEAALAKRERAQKAEADQRAFEEESRRRTSSDEPPWESLGEPTHPTLPSPLALTRGRAPRVAPTLAVGPTYGPPIPVPARGFAAETGQFGFSDKAAADLTAQERRKLGAAMAKEAAAEQVAAAAAEEDARQRRQLMAARARREEIPAGGGPGEPGGGRGSGGGRGGGGDNLPVPYAGGGGEGGKGGGGHRTSYEDFGGSAGGHPFGDIAGFSAVAYKEEYVKATAAAAQAMQATAAAQNAANAQATIANEEYITYTAAAGKASQLTAEKIRARALGLERQGGPKFADSGEGEAQRRAAISVRERANQEREKVAFNRALISEMERDASAEGSIVRLERERIQSETQLRNAESEVRRQAIKEGIASGQLGQGTKFQQIQSALRRGGSNPRAPEEESTLGQFVGQKFATTAGFLFSGALLYGGISQIRSMLTYASELQRTFATIKAQFSSIGQGNQFNGFRSAMLSIARDTGTTASQVATVGFQLKGAFGDTPKAVRETSAAIKLAAVTGLELTEVTDSLTATALTFNTSIEKIGDNALGLQERFGVLAKETIKFTADLAPVGKEAGFSEPQLASLGAVAQQVSGRPGSALAEQFGRVIPGLQTKGLDLVNLYQSVPALQPNLPKIEDALGAGNIEKVFEALLADYPKLTQAQQNYVAELIGGRREAGAVITVLENGRKVLNEWQRGTGEDTGKTEKYFQQLHDTVENTFKRMGEAFKQVGAELFQSGLGQVLGDIGTVLGGLISLVVKVLEPFAAINESTHGWALRLLELYGALKLVRLGIDLVSAARSQELFGALVGSGRVRAVANTAAAARAARAAGGVAEAETTGAVVLGSRIAGVPGSGAGTAATAGPFAAGAAWRAQASAAERVAAERRGQQFIAERAIGAEATVGEEVVGGGLAYRAGSIFGRGTRYVGGKLGAAGAAGGSRLGNFLTGGAGLAEGQSLFSAALPPALLGAALLYGGTAVSKSRFGLQAFPNYVPAPAGREPVKPSLGQIPTAQRVGFFAGDLPSIGKTLGSGHPFEELTGSLGGRQIGSAQKNLAQFYGQKYAGQSREQLEAALKDSDSKGGGFLGQVADTIDKVGRHVPFGGVDSAANTKYRANRDELKRILGRNLQQDPGALAAAEATVQAAAESGKISKEAADKQLSGLEKGDYDTFKKVSEEYNHFKKDKKFKGKFKDLSASNQQQILAANELSTLDEARQQFQAGSLSGQDYLGKLQASIDALDKIKGDDPKKAIQLAQLRKELADQQLQFAQAEYAAVQENLKVTGADPARLMQAAINLLKDPRVATSPQGRIDAINQIDAAHDAVVQGRVAAAQSTADKILAQHPDPTDPTRRSENVSNQFQTATGPIHEALQGAADTLGVSYDDLRKSSIDVSKTDQDTYEVIKKQLQDRIDTLEAIKRNPRTEDRAGIQDQINKAKAAIAGISAGQASTFLSDPKTYAGLSGQDLATAKANAQFGYDQQQFATSPLKANADRIKRARVSDDAASKALADANSASIGTEPDAGQKHKDEIDRATAAHLESQKELLASIQESDQLELERLNSEVDLWASLTGHRNTLDQAKAAVGKADNARRAANATGDETKINAAKIEQNNAAEQQYQAHLDLTNARVEADRQLNSQNRPVAARDSVTLAQLAVSEARRTSGGQQTAERVRAQTQLSEAVEQQRQAAEAVFRDQIQANQSIFSQNRPLAATYAIQAAREALNEARRVGDQGSQATAYAQLVQAQDQYWQSITDIFTGQQDLAAALAEKAGDSVGASAARLGAARSQLARAQSLYNQGRLDAGGLAEAQATVVNAEAAARDADFQQKVSDVQFNVEMQKVSKAQAIAIYQGYLNNADILGFNTKQKQELMLDIKHLRDSVEGIFNIPSELKLPTLYEARRLVQSGGAQNYDNRQVNVTYYAYNQQDHNSNVQDLSAVVSGPPTSGTFSKRY